MIYWIQTKISDIYSRPLLSPSLLHSFFVVLLNPFVHSIPQNGTPTLTVNREIIHALMGYATVSTLGHPLQLTCFMLGVNWKADELVNFYRIFIEIGSLFDRQGEKISCHSFFRHGVVVVVVVTCNSIVVTACTWTHCFEKRHILVV